MRARKTRQEQEAAGGEGGQPLGVLMIYEDLSSGLRARQTFDQIASQLELEADFDLKLWKFDLLREPTLLEKAVSEALQADVVFLAADGRSELPATVKLWLREWLAHKGDNPCALAVSLDPGAQDNPAEAQLVEFVQTAARREGVEVFLQLGEPARQSSEPTAGSLAGRAAATTAGLDESLNRFGDHPYRDWGLNE